MIEPTPIKLYRCERGHAVLTRPSFSAAGERDTAAGLTYLGDPPLCVLCLGTTMNVVSRMVEMKD